MKGVVYSWRNDKQSTERRDGEAEERRSFAIMKYKRILRIKEFVIILGNLQ